MCQNGSTYEKNIFGAGNQGSLQIIILRKSKDVADLDSNTHILGYKGFSGKKIQIQPLLDRNLLEGSNEFQYLLINHNSRNI